MLPGRRSSAAKLSVSRTVRVVWVASDCITYLPSGQVSAQRQRSTAHGWRGFSTVISIVISLSLRRQIPTALFATALFPTALFPTLAFGSGLGRGWEPTGEKLGLGSKSGRFGD